jgi:ABC-type tungstate transport system substrate-binding protein
MILDAEVFQITLLSLQISAQATGLSLIIGLPLGTLLALGRFPGRSLSLSMVNTGMGLGREGVRFAMEDMTNIQMVAIRLNP